MCGGVGATIIYLVSVTVYNRVVKGKKGYLPSCFFGKCTRSSSSSSSSSSHKRSTRLEDGDDEEEVILYDVDDDDDRL